MPDAFRIDDDMMPLAVPAVVDDVVDQPLLIVIIFFRNQNILRTICNTAPQCDIAGVAAHDLNDRAPLMGRGRVAHLVDGFHCCVHGRVKTNGIIRARNVEINRSRKPNRIDSMTGQCLRTAVRAVAADDNDTVDVIFPADLSSLLLPLRRFELRTARRPENRSASLNDIGDAVLIHIDNLFIQQSHVSSLNALHREPIIYRPAHHRADGSIHPRCIPAARKNSNCFHLLCHTTEPPNYPAFPVIQLPAQSPRPQKLRPSRSSSSPSYIPILTLFNSEPAGPLSVTSDVILSQPRIKVYSLSKHL